MAILLFVLLSRHSSTASEHARASQRSYPRTGGGARAADRYVGGAASHLVLAGRVGASVSGHAGERHPHLRGQVRLSVVRRRRRVPGGRIAWRAAGPWCGTPARPDCPLRPGHPVWPHDRDQAARSCCGHHGRAGISQWLSSARRACGHRSRTDSASCADAQGGTPWSVPSLSIARRCGYVDAERLGRSDRLAGPTLIWSLQRLHFGYRHNRTVYAPPPIVNDWTGPYVGVELGAKFGDTNWTATSLRDPPGI